MSKDAHDKYLEEQQRHKKTLFMLEISKAKSPLQSTYMEKMQDTRKSGSIERLKNLKDDLEEPAVKIGGHKLDGPSMTSHDYKEPKGAEPYFNDLQADKRYAREHNVVLGQSRANVVTGPRLVAGHRHQKSMPVLKFAPYTKVDQPQTHFKMGFEDSFDGSAGARSSGQSRSPSPILTT